MDKLSAKLVEKEKELSQLRAELSEQLQKNTLVESEKQIFRATIDQLARDNQALLNLKVSIQSEVKSLETTNLLQRGEITRLQETNANTEQRIEEFQANIEDKDNSILQLQKKISHLAEAIFKKTNPIALAFQKYDLHLAKELLQMGCEHPGYDFRRPWSLGDYPISEKLVSIRTLNQNGVEVSRFGTTRIDTEVLDILIAHDSKKEYKKHINDWLKKSYHLGDLETIAKLYPLSEGKCLFGGIDRAGRRYPTDPFLSASPVKLPDAGDKYSPCLFEYRKDDTAQIRELKKQIQEMINGPLIH